jgi:hypothetical protein
MINQLGNIEDANIERHRLSSCISHVCRLKKREKRKLSQNIDVSLLHSSYDDSKIQTMVSLGIPLLTEQFIVIEYPAVACIMPSSVSFWTAMFVGLSELNTKIKLLYLLSHRRKSATRKHLYFVTVFFFPFF